MYTSAISFQELVDKSNDPEILEKCPDIRWHFIGTCQSNKVNKVLKVRNLSMMETVSTAKLADKLQKSIETGQGKEANINNLRILVQVRKYFLCKSAKEQFGDSSACE